MLEVPKIAFVDVDDTLVRSFGAKRIPMAKSVDFVRKLKAAGALLYCWSSGGAEYARATAEELELVECFEAFLPKPQLLLDDISIGHWNLLEIHPNEAASAQGDLLLIEISRANGKTV